MKKVRSDNPYLDSSSNGLSYTVDRMKGQAIHGHITLQKSERSTLAGMAGGFRVMDLEPGR